MIVTTALDVSGQEDTMTWFTPIMSNWSGFAYLGEHLGYGIHVLWLLLPYVVLYPVSFFIYFMACIGNLLLYIYKTKNYIQGDTSSKSWDKAKEAIAYIVSSFAKIWHGYEVIGMENLPEGPGLLIYYHGVLTVDYGCFVAKLYRETRRSCYSVSEHLMFWIPGIQLVLKVIGCGDRTKAECVELLKRGDLLGIAPGGLREQNFSDNNYTLIWGNRTGFAQVALEAKVFGYHILAFVMEVAALENRFGVGQRHDVPIIPMFTQNLREGYCTFGNTRLTRWLYERIRWIALPVYGGFPVKLRTYIGEPIPYDPNITAKELAEKTKTALEHLINQHQKKPGNIMRALMERFDKHHKDD